MKKSIKEVAIVLFLSALSISCGGNDTKKEGHRADFLPPMQIKIDDAIKGNPELVDLVQSSEKAINEFSDNIERLVQDGNKYLQDDFDMDKASMMDKIKVGKLMIDFASNSTQMGATMVKFTNYVEEQQKQGTLTETQMKAMEQVGQSLQDRIDQINKKYAHYFDKK